ncbi:hypothetical protein PoB_002257100 [Plakobranchus ocellatus]|uniref:Secreted protein n=1 Tax=Plakobranchus ocellatus TaxID=259542 RepID=A0AAV3Z9U4_9GAST|nr:hypothetical protein PoB_002257100 [Plakobranchus ocellatus]
MLSQSGLMFAMSIVKIIRRAAVQASDYHSTGELHTLRKAQPACAGKGMIVTLCMGGCLVFTVTHTLCLRYAWAETRDYVGMHVCECVHTAGGGNGFDQNWP